MTLGLPQLVQGDLVLPLQGLEDLPLRLVKGAEKAVFRAWVTGPFRVGSIPDTPWRVAPVPFPIAPLISPRARLASGGTSSRAISAASSWWGRARSLPGSREFLQDLPDLPLDQGHGVPGVDHRHLNPWASKSP